MSGPGSGPRRRMAGPAGWGARDASEPLPRAVSVSGLAFYGLLTSGAMGGAWLGWSQAQLPGAVVGLLLGALFTPLLLAGALFLGILFFQLGDGVADRAGLRPDAHPLSFTFVRWLVFLGLACATGGVGFLLYHWTPSWMLWMALGGLACTAVAVLGPLALFLAFVRMRMVEISSSGRVWSAAGDPSPFGGPAAPARGADGLLLEVDASPVRTLDEAKLPPTELPGPGSEPPPEPPAGRL